jgi:hypothetical protein
MSTTKRDQILDILQSARPVGGFTKMANGLVGRVGKEDAEAFLSCATLLLARFGTQARGGREVREIVDLVLSRWNGLPQRGFHAEELLRNALAAIGSDAIRYALLAARVPKGKVEAQLPFNVACAAALAGDEKGMLVAMERALKAGVSPKQIQGDEDLRKIALTPKAKKLLAAFAPKPIPVAIKPHLAAVARALAVASRPFEKRGHRVKLGKPAAATRIAAAEKKAKVSFPNDYRALLTLNDGVRLYDNVILGTADWAGGKVLASSRRFIDDSVAYGATGLDDCFPIANLGQPNDWLLYDPRGAARGGKAGYLIILNADELPMKSLVHALEWMGKVYSF